MTEQMKQALDKAAERLQWSSGQMLIDKETLTPADPAVTLMKSRQTERIASYTMVQRVM